MIKRKDNQKFNISLTQIKSEFLLVVNTTRIRLALTFFFKVVFVMMTLSAHKALAEECSLQIECQGQTLNNSIKLVFDSIYGKCTAKNCRDYACRDGASLHNNLLTTSDLLNFKKENGIDITIEACRTTPSSGGATSDSALLKPCRAALEEAEGACNNGSLMMAGDIIIQQANMAVAMDSTLACSSVGKWAGIASGVLGAFKIRCQSAYEECSSTCRGLRKQVEIKGTAQDKIDLSDLIRSCQHEGNKAQGASQNISAVTQALMAAQGCKNAVSASPTPTYCASFPDAPSCKGPVDCSKPEFANELVCICTANPSNPQCIQNNYTLPTNPVGGNYGTDGTITPNGKLNLDGDGGDGGFNPNFDFSAGRNDSGSPVKGGGGGGGGPPGAGMPGGSGRPQKNSGGAGGPGAYNTKVLNGYYSGGGGIGGGSSGSGSSGSGGGQGGSSGKYANNGKPNLNQFLPGGAFDPKKRDYGITGPDGITGPHSNIWEKINTRYQVVKSRLNQ